MIKQGFSMVEFLIYFCLLAMLSMLLMDFAVSLHTRIAQLGKKNAAYVALSAAHDSFAYALKTSPSDLSRWKKIEKNEHIWCVENDSDIGWKFENGSLLRLEGEYNQHAQAWQRVTKSLTANNLVSCIIQLIFSEENNDRVQSVSIELKNKLDQTVSGVITPRNRVYQ